MKKILTIFGICLLLIFGIYEINHYDMEGVVYAQEGNVLVLLDNTDNLWEIDYTETLKVGDKIKITFNTNGTDDERCDDRIECITTIE